MTMQTKLSIQVEKNTSKQTIITAIFIIGNGI